MSGSRESTLTKSGTGIQIVGLNSDKTHKTYRSDNSYQVYFELSGVTSHVWNIIFEREWKTMISADRWNVGITEAKIACGFLVLHCPLQEVATIYLPVLKETVAAANKEYDQYVRQQAVEHLRREVIWKEERKSVHEMAESLLF